MIDCLDVVTQWVDLDVEVRLAPGHRQAYRLRQLGSSARRLEQASKGSKLLQEVRADAGEAGRRAILNRTEGAKCGR